MYVQCLECGTFYENTKKRRLCPECDSNVYKILAVSNEEIAEDSKEEK
jgi:predicted  nucleic acid-binding Zn-ribbon protein